MPTKTKKSVKKKSTPRKQQKQPISEDILMGELLERYPETTEILMKYGFHCVGCMISPYESLASGAAVHGLPLPQILKEINQIVTKQK